MSSPATREPVRRQHHIAGVEPRAVYDVVVDFARYPRLFPELKEARVLERDGDRVRVEFRAQVVLPVRYVLDLVCQPDAPAVDWTFVEGEVMTNSVGGWRFLPERGGTTVQYTVSVDLKAPVPGFVLRKVTDGLVAASIPNMFAALEREVRG
jgi:ribosome-associated toxin RatA of RatAB toxin-antitoxin module